MEFNVFEYFKDYQRITKGPMTPEEQGTSLFLAGSSERALNEADAAGITAVVVRDGDVQLTGALA